MKTIEIINKTRGASSVKFGNAAIGGQIQVPNVHSFTMYVPDKKVVLDGFFYFINCFSP